MKIVLTVHQFPPEYISGTEVLTFSVAKDLMRRGHEVRVHLRLDVRVVVDMTGDVHELARQRLGQRCHP